MVFLSLFQVVFFTTCLPPVESFWFFSCRHGNGNGVVGDPCWALCQCRAPNTCEAGVQRCVSPGRLKDHCHLTKPCGRGLSCHPGIQKCYHVPRRLYEPCVAGYECGSGLSCQPGIQVCFHALRRYNEPCVGGYPCGPGLSCQPGVQRCLHFPRLENERCSLGFECGAGLECTLCAEPYLTCQLGRVPHQDDEFYRRPYNKVAFLVTHNSFSNGIEYAVWVHNQRVSVAQQLKDGVRGLMLDIYPGWGKAEVRLCHAVCFWGGSTDLLDTLVEIRHFLESNPREVVTIIFEDYLRNPTILKHVFDRAGISSHVLVSKHWGSLFRDWPTLEQMRTLGRLVVFNNNGLEGFPYTRENMWYYVRENRYGHPGLDTKTCVDRAESQYNVHYKDNWSLVLVNWFGTIPNPLDPCLNSFSKLREKLSTCQQAFGQLPNFLAVDFYHDGEKGGAFKAVEWLNEQWKAQFPTARKSFTKIFKMKHLQQMKKTFKNYWDEMTTGLNGTETEKNVTTMTDHVINTTNLVMNMTHVVNPSGQSGRRKFQGVNVTDHVINVTGHVMGNSSEASVAMEMSVHNKSVVEFGDIISAMKKNGREDEEQSTSKSVALLNNSGINEESWENRTRIKERTKVRVSNTSGLIGLRNNETEISKNFNKMAASKMKSDSNQSKIEQNFHGGIILNDKKNNSSDSKGLEGDLRIVSNISPILQWTNNTNLTQSERILNQSNILSHNYSKNFSQEKMFTNTTARHISVINLEKISRTNNVNQTASQDELVKPIFDLFSPRNLTIYNTETRDNETAGTEQGTGLKQAKSFWNHTRNRTGLLEEIIDDL